MSTDYRTLCARMADELDHYRQLLTDNRRETHALATEARAALAQPEPVAPTDEELLAMRSWSCHGPTFDSDLVDFGHRCYNLGRYGTPAIQPVALTDEALEATARAAEIQYMKEHGGLTASTPDGIHAQLQAQRLAGLRAVAARAAIAAELDGGTTANQKDHD
jgi:hypothetical protein